MSSAELFEPFRKLPLLAPPVRQPSNQNSDSVSAKTWLAVIGSALGAFLAVLNIQVVNSALADIQGAIGAGIDDGGWISTSYLIAEIIVIPLSGWLTKVFSTRNYLIANTFLFLIFSVACATSQNLGQMIVWRALQGFSGGVLIPMAFTIIMTMLPSSKQPIGLALFTLSAVFAPAIGPTVGGYLNETYGWHYIFYVNLAPGLLMLGMLWVSLEREPMRLGLLKEGDWLGVITMAIGLGALQTVLEEGNKDDWFGSTFILRLSIIAAVALSLFLWIEFTVKKPLLELRLLWRRNFGLATLATALLGMVLYGSVFVMSLYLSQLQGYNSEQIGEVLAWVGLPQLLLIPFLPTFTRRFDARLLIIVGFGLFAASNFLNIHLTDYSAGPQLLWPNVVRAFGQAITIAPLSAIAVAGIEREYAGSASSIFNMTRNLGGAIGIAMFQTFLTHREQYHSEFITSSVSLFDRATQHRLDDLTQYFKTHGVSDPAYAWQEAAVSIGRSIHQEASIMSYSDAFFLQGVILVLALSVIFFLRKAKATGGGAH
jgi:DHA2 family multidrug resistance protein